MKNRRQNYSFINPLDFIQRGFFCRSRKANSEVIGQMVDTIVKAHNWSLVDAVDRNGDTALHVAARLVIDSSPLITHDWFSWP